MSQSKPSLIQCNFLLPVDDHEWLLELKKDTGVLVAEHLRRLVRKDRLRREAVKRKQRAKATRRASA